MTRRARFELVRSSAGWFARFISSNGKEVWRTSETYQRAHGARRAMLLRGDAPRYSDGPPFIEVREIDERDHA